MEYTNKAIDKACENGYTWTIDVTAEKIFLDPLFWKSLGKAMGWEEKARKTFEGMKIIQKNSWLYHWRKFIEHLASEKSAEDFFRNLLS